MGVIWTPKKRAIQPQNKVAVNKETPLTSGLSFLWSASQSKKEITKEIEPSGYWTTPVLVAPTPFGLAGRNAATAATKFDATRFPSSTRYTYLAFVLDDAGRGSTRNFFDSDDGGSARIFQFRCTSSNTVEFIAFNTVGGNSSTFTTSATTSSTAPQVIAARSNGDGSLDLFINGASKTTSLLLLGTTIRTNSEAGAKYSIGGAAYDAAPFPGGVLWAAAWSRALSDAEIQYISANPWVLFAPERRPIVLNVSSGSNNTATLSSTLDAATLTGVGNVTRSGTLAVTLDAATLAGIGTAAVTNKTGTLAVTLDAATLTGVGAVTTSGTLAVTLDAATLAGVGSVAVGTNRDGTLAVTLDAATLSGIGAVTTSGTLAVTLDNATLAGIGTAGQAVTGTLAVTLANATLRGIGAIPAAPSTGGGKTTGSNLSRKQKKKLKAVESQEWLKAEETARQLLSDRFTKQTPQEKAQALETHIESLTPVIEALKAITDQIEDVQETVQETKTEELTEHKQILNKFDALITKMTSIEELLIIMLAQ